MTVKKTAKPVEVAKKEYWILADGYHDSCYIFFSEKEAVGQVQDMVTDGADPEYLEVYVANRKLAVVVGKVELKDA